MEIVQSIQAKFPPSPQIEKLADEHEMQEDASVKEAEAQVDISWH